MQRARRRHERLGFGLAVVGAWQALAACAPALNWRDWRAPGSTLQAVFPCRPASVQRTVPLAGRPARMTLAACDAQGATWALAWADVGDPAQVTPALAGLRAAALANLDAAASANDDPLRPPGAAANVHARAFTVAGRRPDGAAVQSRVALFAHGTTVWQATVLAPRLDAAALATFFGALRFVAP